MGDKVVSDEEEAPESVSFGSSRETALSALKEEKELSKGTSHKQKRARDEKRKRRQERKDETLKAASVKNNLEKLNTLREKAKEALAEKPKTDEVKLSNNTTVKNTKKVFSQEPDELDDSDEEESSGFIPFSESNKRNKRTSREIDTSGSSKLRVELVSSKKPKVLAAKSVLNFRETMLYGAGSKVKRESSKVVIARKEKMKLSGKNVLCT